MEQITFNSSNEPYYSEDFIKGFKCGAKRQLEADKKARPKGEWIKRHGTINCSVCKRSNWSACFEDTVRTFNFCPNCGCAMTKE